MARRDARLYSRYIFAGSFRDKLENSTTLAAARGEIIVKSPLTKSATSSPPGEILMQIRRSFTSNVKLNQADPAPMGDSARKSEQLKNIHASTELYISKTLSEAHRVRSGTIWTVCD